MKNSTFHVLIFDTTAYEIQYSYNGGEPGNTARPSTASIWRSKFKQGHEPQSKKSKMEELMERNESTQDTNF